MLKANINKPDTFLNFAYGANVLDLYMTWFQPSAEFVSIARLDNYRIDFMKYNHFWGSPTATMVPTANAHIWGVIWRVHIDDLKSLDDQMGVEKKKYFIKYVDVLTPYMGYFRCRAYMQRVYPLPRGDRDPIPVEQWPSWAYKEILIMGAKEHGMPDCYIEYLKRLKHNGEEGCIRTALLIRRYGRDQPCECSVSGRYLRKPLKLKRGPLGWGK